MNLLTKPYYIFWGIIPLLVIFYFLTNPNVTFDINIHDTYFVIAYKPIFYFIGILFGCLGLVYWCLCRFHKKLYKSLIILHSTFTLIGILLIFGITLCGNYFSSDPTYSYEFKNSSVYLQGLDINDWITVILIGIILTQLLFICNFIISFFRKPQAV